MAWHGMTPALLYTATTSTKGHDMHVNGKEKFDSRHFLVQDTL